MSSRCSQRARRAMLPQKPERSVAASMRPVNGLDAIPHDERRLEPRSAAKASRPSRSKLGVEPLEFDAGVGGCELPIGFGVMLVSMGLPGCDLAFEG